MDSCTVKATTFSLCVPLSLPLSPLLQLHRLFGRSHIDFFNTYTHSSTYILKILLRNLLILFSDLLCALLQLLPETLSVMWTAGKLSVAGRFVKRSRGSWRTIIIMCLFISLDGGDRDVSFAADATFVDTLRVPQFVSVWGMTRNEWVKE